MSEAPLPGPLDEFLSRPPVRPEPAELRRALLQRTSLLVRRRRLVRRLAVAASSAAAILVTALIIWIAFFGRPEPERKEQPFVEQRNDIPLPAPVPRDEEMHRGKQDPELGLPAAVAMEWKAFDAPAAEKAALYVQAGDRYVEDGQDLASALRCYGQAVKTAPVETLAIDPDDNWLVMALKMDQIERRQEK
jgi:hypothetical protein